VRWAKTRGDGGNFVLGVALCKLVQQQQNVMIFA
jgi:hypothetical protein